MNVKESARNVPTREDFSWSGPLSGSDLANLILQNSLGPITRYFDSEVRIMEAYQTEEASPLKILARGFRFRHGSEYRHTHKWEKSWNCKPKKRKENLWCNLTLCNQPKDGWFKWFDAFLF